MALGKMKRPARLARISAIAALFAVLSVATSQLTRAESFGVDRLASAAFSPDCLDWKIAGVCVFLRCGIFGCYIATSPKISHRLPDLVVQSYIQTGKPPWREWQPIAQSAAQSAVSALGGQLSGGASSGSGPHRYTDALQFHETDVVGNPIAKLLKAGPFLCKSDVTPMKPFFVSVTDSVAWRSGTGELERPESVTPGLREIGSGSRTWGAIYPRTGFVIQHDPTRAAAVAAARGIDIVTRDQSNHIAQDYKSQNSARIVRRGDTAAKNPVACQDSGGQWVVTKGDGNCESRNWRQWRTTAGETEANWQRITPEPAKQCRRFGGPDSPSRVAEDGQYAWQYWVRYQCCMKLGSFLGIL